MSININIYTSVWQHVNWLNHSNEVTSGFIIPAAMEFWSVLSNSYVFLPVDQTSKKNQEYEVSYPHSTAGSIMGDILLVEWHLRLYIGFTTRKSMDALYSQKLVENLLNTVKSIQEEARFQLSSDLPFLYFAAKICGICHNQKVTKQNKRHKCEKCSVGKKGYKRMGGS